jgi:hypothetical protein
MEREFDARLHYESYAANYLAGKINPAKNRCRVAFLTVRADVNLVILKCQRAFVRKSAQIQLKSPSTFTDPIEVAQGAHEQTDEEIGELAVALASWTKNYSPLNPEPAGNGPKNP